MRRYLCGVPEQECNGATHPIILDEKWRGTHKHHGTRGQAFQCMVLYLLANGYRRIDTREFQHKNGGPVRILTKPSKYGYVLRGGKEGRVMPENPNYVIIG